MTDNESIIRENCLRLAGGDISKALDLAIAGLDYYRRSCSAGFIRENPAHRVRPPKPQPEPILTNDGL